VTVGALGGPGPLDPLARLDRLDPLAMLEAYRRDSA
jgi:hypothetical protein